MFVTIATLFLFTAVAAQTDPCKVAHTDQASCDADKKTGGGCTWVIILFVHIFYTKSPSLFLIHSFFFFPTLFSSFLLPSFQCKCGALPSACWTLSNSKKLPPGVYQCDAATSNTTKITDGHAYKVEDLVSGNFSIVTVSMSPVDSGSDWEENDVAQITILGTTSKKILAGTIKYQIFETEVKSFIASGDSPYFVVRAFVFLFLVPLFGAATLTPLCLSLHVLRWNCVFSATTRVVIQRKGLHYILKLVRMVRSIFQWRCRYHKHKGKLKLFIFFDCIIIKIFHRCRNLTYLYVLFDLHGLGTLLFFFSFFIFFSLFFKHVERV